MYGSYVPFKTYNEAFNHNSIELTTKKKGKEFARTKVKNANRVKMQNLKDGKNISVFAQTINVRFRMNDGTSHEATVALDPNDTVNHFSLYLLMTLPL